MTIETLPTIHDWRGPSIHEIARKGLFESRPPMLIVPLSKEEREVLKNEIKVTPVGKLKVSLPDEFDTIIRRGEKIVKDRFPFVHFYQQFVDGIWTVTEAGTKHEDQIPHSDRIIDPAMAKFTYPQAIVRVTIAVSEGNDSSGTIFFPGTYSTSKESRLEDQAKKHSQVIVPEGVMAVFTGIDVHAAPISTSNRGLLTFSLYSEEAEYREID